MQDPIQEAVDKLKLAKIELKSQLANVDNAIKSLEGSPIQKNGASLSMNLKSHAQEYDKQWSLPNKFLFLLKHENRFLHFREAGDLIVNLEGKGDAKEFGRKLSASCGKLKTESIIVKFKVGTSNVNTFWGSPKWIDNEGNVIEGHEYNEKYLASGGKKSAPLFEL